MLDGSDGETFRALRLLCDTARGTGKPLALWVGAGASAWLKYPLWSELAESMHSVFARYEPDYPADHGIVLVAAREYPALFELCRGVDRRRYYEQLSTAVSPRAITPVYRRFANAVQRATPAGVITTNVDHALENALGYPVLGRFDTERASRAIDDGTPFILKVHGSADSLEQTVFTQSDYDTLSSHPSLLAQLSALVSRLSLVFVGYGLGDQYFLDVLEKNDRQAPLLGDGPHFAVLAERRTRLPQNVRSIRYTPTPHKDHRSAVIVVEEIALARHSVHQPTDNPNEPRSLESTHILSNVLPPGTWLTSQVLGVTAGDGAQRQLVSGTGFTQEELPLAASSAFHDVVVGLICFERVVVPIGTAGRTHQLLGPERFWRLIQDDALSLYSCEQEDFVVFPEASAPASGEIVSAKVANPDQSPLTVAQQLRRQILPTEGHEDEAARLLDVLERRTLRVDCADPGELPALVRGLLVRPSVRGLLGMSGGTSVTSIPRWLAFPALRLAAVARAGLVCRRLGAASVKLEFGMAGLAGPAFAASAGREWVESAANYVVAGRFDAGLGSLTVQQPAILDAVMRFRGTAAASVLRRQVLGLLAAGEGSDVAAAINGGLHGQVPSRTLQEARNAFVSLLVSEGEGTRSAAIWNDQRCADEALARWKQRSLGLLDDCMTERGLRLYDSCPCGSGEQLKFCCWEALRA